MAAGATVAFPAFTPGHGKPAGADSPGDFLELIKYRLLTGAKKNSVRDFYKDAAIPALNRLGISPVGIFTVKYGANDPSLYALLPHKNLESFLTLTDRLLADAEFMKAGDEFLNAPFSDPAFARMEKILLKCFSHQPSVNTPSGLLNNPSRIYEMRTYESHNIPAARKKIEMFNEGGEIEIFRKTGLFSVFFGETLAGPLMPNLTYMLVFNDMTERDKKWADFGNDPGWKKLSADPQYKDTVSNITDVILAPDACSQV